MIRIFFIITILHLISCTRSENLTGSNCSQVRNGDFYILEEGKLKTTVSRTGDVQVERLTDGSVSRFRVQWLDSCRYRLTYMSGNKVTEEKILRPVLVQILEVNDSSYIVEGRVEGTAFGTAKLELFKGNPGSDY